MLNHIFYSINNNLSSYYVPEHLFMNELEQYIFINPYEKIKDKVDEKYLIHLNNANFFTDCTTIVNGILSGKASEYIDPWRVRDISVCCSHYLLNETDIMSSINFKIVDFPYPFGAVIIVNALDSSAIFLKIKL